MATSQPPTSQPRRSNAAGAAAAGAGAGAIPTPRLLALRTDVYERMLDVVVLAGQRELQAVGLADRVVWNAERPDVQAIARRRTGELFDRVFETAGKRARVALAELLGRALDPIEMGKALQERFQQITPAQAQMAVRSEVRDLYNEATLDAWEAAGMKQVRASDGHGGLSGVTDADCKARDGKVYSIAQARAENHSPVTHPRCTLSWVPIVPKGGLNPPALAAELVTDPMDLVLVFDEHLHPRDPGGEGGGEFVRKPLSILANGFAEAAQMMADGYSAKAQRDLNTGLGGVDEWLAGGAHEQHDMGIANAYAVDWDTGRRMVLVGSTISPDQGGAVGYLDDPDTAGKLHTRAQQVVDAWKETTLATQRKQLRGAIAADKGEDGKLAYRAMRNAIATNESLPTYRALHQRFPDVPDEVILISESGYGRANSGIKDVLVTASRNLNNGITSFNALALTVHQRFAEKDVWYLHGPNGPGTTKPGDFFVSTRDPAGTMRHEWGHGLWDALSDRQRADFIALLPGWDGIASGLSRYAAGDEESRAKYDKIVNPGKGGYYTETFAEALALVTGPYYERADWPEWVGRLADWIGTVKPE